MSRADKMRSECDQINAQVRECIMAIPSETQLNLAEFLQIKAKHTEDKLQAIVYGLALLGLANIFTSIAELHEADA